MRWDFSRRRLTQLEQESKQRDDQFRDRLISAIERPPTVKLFKVLNSAFFLWSLTAILLTCGGSYLTKRQECLRDFAKMSEAYDPLQDEIFHRRAGLVAAVRKLSDFEQLAELLKTQSSRDPSLSNVSLTELVFRRDRLVRSIDFGGYKPDNELRARLFEHFSENTDRENATSNERLDSTYNRYYRHTELWRVFNGGFSKLTKELFFELKNMPGIPLFAALYNDRSGGASPNLVARCDLGSLISGALDDSPAAVGRWRYLQRAEATKIPGGYTINFRDMNGIDEINENGMDSLMALPNEIEQNPSPSKPSN
jgi:hypothetical protein